MSDKTALITTVIPTFRRPKLLQRAIGSVLTQSVEQVRVLVSDNNSGDETEGIVQRLMRADSRISYVKRPENIGAVSNIIQGIKEVNSEFFSLLSDDDFLLPGFYQAALNSFRVNPQAGFVCAKTLTINLSTKRLQLRNRDWKPGYYDSSAAVIGHMYRSHFAQTGVLMRSDMRELIGPFEPTGNDILNMTMAAACAPFAVLDLYGAAFILHPESYSATGGISQEQRAQLHHGLLTTIDTVTKMPVKEDIKILLISYVTNAYFSIFEQKSYQEVIRTRSDSIDDREIPARVTLPGLMLKLYTSVPPSVRPLIAHIGGFVAYLRRRQLAILGASAWAPLAPSDCRTIGNAESTSSQFAVSVENVLKIAAAERMQQEIVS